MDKLVLRPLSVALALFLAGWIAFDWARDRQAEAPRLVKASAATDGALAASPQLRLELGMHGARIWDLDVSADGRWAATASEDKTIRVWAVPEGGEAAWRLDKVLRPPLGPGSEGKVYAVAVHPDGRWIAAGGWFEGDDSQDSVYVFDRVSGEIVRRLALVDPGAVSATHSLAFSDDGTRLAAGRSWDLGVRVWATAGDPPAWRRLFDLEEPEYDVYGVDFAADGRLAVASLDSVIRLYGADGALIRARDLDDAAGGARPFRLAFSPARGGAPQRLAVGFENRRRVDILSGADLSPLAAGDWSGVSGVQGAARVGWSADGATLYAGGRGYETGDRYQNQVVRAFGPDGAALWTARAAGNTIAGLRGLPDGRIAFASVEPSIGLLGPDGGDGPAFPPQQIDVRDARPPASSLYFPMRVSPDGRTVDAPLGNPFDWDEGETPHLSARVGARAVGINRAADAALRAPRLAAGGTRVDAWDDTYSPEINGETLGLRDYDRSRAAAVSADGRRAVLAANYGLYRYEIGTPGGAPRGLPFKAGPSVGLRVNLSEDGSLIIAAFADGTIRWYDFESGDLLLSLFVTPDQDAPEWVYWTPQGYYDASPGAESLLVWHVNRGADETPLFYPLAKFRGRYYRPDVIERVLDARNVQTALDDANDAIGAGPEDADAEFTDSERLPPVATILSPEDGAAFYGEAVSLRVRVSAPGRGAITGVRTLRNGKPWPAARERNPAAAIKDGAELEFVFPGLPRSDARLGVIVDGEDGSSVLTEVRVAYAGDRAPAARERRLRALIVGVSNYDAFGSVDEGDLRWAHKDAEDFENFLKQSAAANGFVDPDVRRIPQSEATQRRIIDEIAWLRDSIAREDDVGILFLAGHGFTKQFTGEQAYYFLPRDGDPARLEATAVDEKALDRLVRNSGQGSLMLILDTCRAGSTVLDRAGAQAFDTIGIANRYNSGTEAGTAVVITSATGDQPAIESDDLENGVFTDVLLEALSGAADSSNDGVIRRYELASHLDEEVRRKAGRAQRPAVAGTFPSEPPDPNPVLFTVP